MKAVHDQPSHCTDDDHMCLAVCCKEYQGYTMWLQTYDPRNCHSYIKSIHIERWAFDVEMLKIQEMVDIPAQRGSGQGGQRLMAPS